MNSRPLALRMATIVVLVVVSLLYGRVGAAASSVDRSRLTTLFALLANPDQHHGERVVVSGYCSVRFEDLAIYLSEEDFRWHVPHAVWLDLPLDSIAKLRRPGFRCLVDGTFNSRNYGHMGGFVGSIEQISRIEPWSVGKPSKRK